MNKSSKNTGSYFPHIKTARPTGYKPFCGVKLFLFRVSSPQKLNNYNKKVNSCSLQAIFSKKMLEDVFFILKSNYFNRPTRCMRGRVLVF